MLLEVRVDESGDYVVIGSDGTELARLEPTGEHPEQYLEDLMQLMTAATKRQLGPYERT
jgi:hypothetical protein